MDSDASADGHRAVAVARAAHAGIPQVTSLAATRRAAWIPEPAPDVAGLPDAAPPLPAYAVKEPTLLGEEISEEGAITPTGVDRVVDASCRAMDAALEHRVDELYVFATAAIRDATNRDEVLDRVAAEAGVRPQYLSGEDEARLTYHAAHRWYGWSANRILLLDIGGGTMEIALGRDAEPDLALSVPLGARRLTRKLSHRGSARCRAAQSTPRAHPRDGTRGYRPSALGGPTRPRGRYVEDLQTARPAHRFATTTQRPVCATVGRRQGSAPVDPTDGPAARA